MDKSDAKLQLSAEEMRLVTDPVWILTKNSIMAKVVGLFAGLSEEWRERWGGGQLAGVPGRESRVPGRLSLVPRSEPKISRGENYKGLPWVMLDYPRVFGREDVFAIRTMFWWGHAFSVTLHLKGEWQRLFLPVIVARKDALAAAGFQWGVMEDEWEHGHTGENYRPLVRPDPEEGPNPGDEPDLGDGPGEALAVTEWPGATDRPFLKLSGTVALESWAEAPEMLTALFVSLLTSLSGEGNS
jgi:hypothetical protein